MGLLEEITKALELSQGDDKNRGQRWQQMFSGIAGSVGDIISGYQAKKAEDATSEALRQMMSPTDATPDLSGQLSAIPSGISGGLAGMGSPPTEEPWKTGWGPDKAGPLPPLPSSIPKPTGAPPDLQSMLGNLMGKPNPADIEKLPLTGEMLSPDYDKKNRELLPATGDMLSPGYAKRNTEPLRALTTVPDRPGVGSMSGLDPLKIMQIALTQNLPQARRDELMKMASGLMSQQQARDMGQQEREFNKWKTTETGRYGQHKAETQAEAAEKRARIQARVRMLEERLQQQGLNQRQKDSIRAQMDRLNKSIGAANWRFGEGEKGRNRRADTAETGRNTSAAGTKESVSVKEARELAGRIIATINDPDAEKRPGTDEIALTLAGIDNDAAARAFVQRLRAGGYTQREIASIIAKAKRAAGK